MDPIWWQYRLNKLQQLAGSSLRIISTHDHADNRDAVQAISWSSGFGYDRLCICGVDPANADARNRVPLGSESFEYQSDPLGSEYILGVGFAAARQYRADIGKACQKSHVGVA